MNVSLRKFIFSGLSIWALITVFGVYFLLNLKKNINFGVDLVGGTYITLRVQMEKAIEAEVAQKLQSAVSLLKKGEKAEPKVMIENNNGYLVFPSADAASAAEDFLISQDARYFEPREENKLKVTLSAEEIAKVKREALMGNIHVLEQRLNPTGAAEISIVQQGDNHIVVELPNVHDVRQAKSMIGKTALLEIKLVEDVGMSKDDLLKKYDGKLPDNLIMLPSQERTGRQMYYLVAKQSDLTGRLLKNAEMYISEENLEPAVRFEFKSEGGQKFYDLTSKNIGKQVAIIIDDVVISAPVVQSAIGNEGTITGRFTQQEAQSLATMLKSGAFVAPVSFEEERHIGPSLGYQSIKNGLIACLVGLLALLVFALFVYKTSGLLAFIVLLYNILVILFAMAMLGATLTLPGIAGMILTVGMAIDASILIFERVREELATGSPFKKALNVGFSGAMAVILDANITHFLVALVLYKFGAGPIRGFAIAMLIGIVSTLATGILLLKSLFNFVLEGLGFKSIKI